MKSLLILLLLSSNANPAYELVVVGETKDGETIHTREIILLIPRDINSPPGRERHILREEKTLCKVLLNHRANKSRIYGETKVRYCQKLSRRVEQ